jgi:hypothetical protein
MKIREFDMDKNMCASLSSLKSNINSNTIVVWLFSSIFFLFARLLQVRQLTPMASLTLLKKLQLFVADETSAFTLMDVSVDLFCHSVS